MILSKFIEKFIEPNTIIRLVYKDIGGHKLIHQSWDDVSMEWEILKGEGKNKNYINSNVIGVTGILISGPYSDAVNIVIDNL